MSLIWGLLAVVVVVVGLAGVLGLLALGGLVVWQWLSDANRVQQLRLDGHAAERQIEEIARRTDQAIIAEMLRRQQPSDQR